MSWLVPYLVGGLLGTICMAMLYVSRNAEDSDAVRLDHLTRINGSLTSFTDDTGVTWWSVVRNNAVIGWSSKTPREAIDSAMLSFQTAKLKEGANG